MKTLRVGYVQGNIAQDIKWDEAKSREHEARYRTLGEALAGKASLDLIVFPETAYPYLVYAGKKEIEGASLGVPLLLGANVYRGELNDLGHLTYYNSALLLDGKGQIQGRYDKVHLVPMGEYVPLRTVFFFVDKIVPGLVDFSPGNLDQLLNLTADIFSGMTICYEDLFPEISRRLVKRGAHFLINMTNDAWYGVSSAPYHHLIFSQYRSIETRRWLVRSTNTGISAFIDPVGRFYETSSLFSEAIAWHDIQLRYGKTIYVLLGDWVAWGCLVFLGFAIFLGIRVRP